MTIEEYLAKIGDRIIKCCDRMYGFGACGQIGNAKKEEYDTLMDVRKLIEEVLTIKLLESK